MKILILMLTLIFAMSCTHVCKIATSEADKLGTKIEKRWECEKGEVSSEFENILAKTMCKEDSKARGIFAVVCPIAGQALSNLGAAFLADKYKCNYALVEKDLKNVSGFCSILM